MPKRFCVRNGVEAFVAKGNQIEVSILNSKVTKMLKLPLVDENIEELVLNNSGTFLAVICKSKVFSVILPPNNFLDKAEKEDLLSKKKEIIKWGPLESGKKKIIKGGPLESEKKEVTKEGPLEHHEIGHVFYQQEITIIKAIWNPIAKYDSDLVVLSSDGMIRSFELTLSHNEPVDSYDLYGEQSQRLQNAPFSVSAVNSIQKPIGITFGSDNVNDPVGCLTLYVFSEEGNLYLLYPFHPLQMSVPHKFVDILFDQTSLMFGKVREKLTNEEQYDEDELGKIVSQKGALSLQLLWISKLSKQLEGSSKEYKYVTPESCILEEFCIISAPSRISQLKLQGPLQIDNLPTGLTSDYSIKGLDLVSVNNGDINLLNLAYNNGDMIMLIQSNDLFMRWEEKVSSDMISSEDLSSESFVNLDKEDVDYFLNPSAVVLQHIKLSSPTGQKMQISLVSTNVPCLFFVFIDCAKQYILKVDFFQWGKDLNDLIIDNFNSNGTTEAVKGFLETQYKNNFLKIEKLFDGTGYDFRDLVGIDLCLTEDDETYIIYIIKDKLHSVNFSAQEKHQDEMPAQNPPKLPILLKKIKFNQFKTQFEENNLVIKNFVDELLNNQLVQQFSKVSIKNATNNDIPSDEFNMSLIAVMEKITGKFVQNVVFLTEFQIQLGHNLEALKHDLEYQLVKLNQVIDIIKKLTVTTNISGNNEKSENEKRFDKILSRHVTLNTKLQAIISQLYRLKVKHNSNNPQGVFKNNLPISNFEMSFFLELRKLTTQTNLLRLNYNKISKQVDFFKKYTTPESLVSKTIDKPVLEPAQLSYLNNKLKEEDHLIKVSKDMVKKAIEDLEDEGENL